MPKMESFNDGQRRAFFSRSPQTGHGGELRDHFKCVLSSIGYGSTDLHQIPGYEDFVLTASGSELQLCSVIPKSQSLAED